MSIEEFCDVNILHIVPPLDSTSLIDLSEESAEFRTRRITFSFTIKEIILSNSLSVITGYETTVNTYIGYLHLISLFPMGDSNIEFF